MSKAPLLEDIIRSHAISKFSKEWIDNSNSDEKQIKRNYKFLKKIGLSDEKIASQAQLLGMNPETIERNYRSLSQLGLKDEKIATLAHLLGMNPETIERNYQALSKLGLKDEKIASRAELLGRDPETIERNYKNLISLLRDDYQDRNSGKNFIMKYAQLLGMNPETIKANVQYLHGLGINYNAILLGTTPQLKRKKMVWLLREVFDYQNVDNKKEIIERMYDFVRNNLRYLMNSISVMEKSKDKIKEIAKNY